MASRNIVILQMLLRRRISFALLFNVLTFEFFKPIRSFINPTLAEFSWTVACNFSSTHYSSLSKCKKSSTIVLQLAACVPLPKENNYELYQLNFQLGSYIFSNFVVVKFCSVLSFIHSLFSFSMWHVCRLTKTTGKMNMMGKSFHIKSILHEQKQSPWMKTACFIMWKCQLLTSFFSFRI